MKLLEIHVTEKDIRKAKKAAEEHDYRYDISKSCPIAQALVREYNCNPYVNYDEIRVAGEFIDTTKRMKKFIQKYDDNLKVSPQNFRVLFYRSFKRA